MIHFRPIILTKAVALVGAVSIAIDQGTGSELRHSLGIGAVGDLIVSQLPALFITPISHLHFKRLSGIERRLCCIRKRYTA